MSRSPKRSSPVRRLGQAKGDPPARSPTFTVFTPTHNRAGLLHRVFDALRAQTDQDFEWLVVDDGSTDGTEAVVTAWAAEAAFPVRYLRQAHAGKHVAFNRAVREARGGLFLTWDSDDGAVPQAIERFRAVWDGIPLERRPRFSAVSALRREADGTLIGDRFPGDVTDSDSLDLYFRLRVRGDKWGFQRTDVLLEHPFPEPPGQLFVAESVVWFAIARRYRTRFVNEVLGINFPPAAGEAHLSTLTPGTARGRLLFHQAVIEDYLDFARVAPDLILKSLVNYSRYAFVAGIGPLAQLARLRSTGRRLLALSAMPAGYLFAVRDRLRQP